MCCIGYFSCSYDKIPDLRMKNFVMSQGLNGDAKDWRDGSVAKCISCSSRLPRFNSQHPHNHM